MLDYIESDLLSIGGIDFQFSSPVCWPMTGGLSCYQSFIAVPSPLRVSAPSPQTSLSVSVSFKRGAPQLAPQPSDTLDSGDGTRWYRSGDIPVVEKILPHVSPDPLWTVLINIPDRHAEIWFSEKYLEIEELCGEWPVAAPRYPIDQHLAVHFLAPNSGMLVHSAGIDHKGKGFMCSGVSGAGKTTISRMLNAAEGFDLLTDDRVILRASAGDEVVMHGTPWSGEGQYATSDAAPLKAMLFLKKAQEARADRLSVSDTVSRCMPVTSVPWFNRELMTDTMSTLETVAQATPAFDLYFTKTADTIDLITDIMSAI